MQRQLQTRAQTVAQNGADLVCHKHHLHLISKTCVQHLFVNRNTTGYKHHHRFYIYSKKMQENHSHIFCYISNAVWEVSPGGFTMF